MLTAAAHAVVLVSIGRVCAPFTANLTRTETVLVDQLTPFITQRDLKFTNLRHNVEQQLSRLPRADAERFRSTQYLRRRDTTRAPSSLGDRRSLPKVYVEGQDWLLLGITTNWARHRHACRKTPFHRSFHPRRGRDGSSTKDWEEKTTNGANSLTKDEQCC